MRRLLLALALGVGLSAPASAQPGFTTETVCAAARSWLADLEPGAEARLREALTAAAIAARGVFERWPMTLRLAGSQGEQQELVASIECGPGAPLVLATLRAPFDVDDHFGAAGRQLEQAIAALRRGVQGEWTGSFGEAGLGAAFDIRADRRPGRPQRLFPERQAADWALRFEL